MLQERKHLLSVSLLPTGAYALVTWSSSRFQSCNQNHHTINAISATPPRFTHNIDSPQARWALNRRSRLALLTTVSDENAMAAPAITGLSSNPKNGYRIPAATGMPATL